MVNGLTYVSFMTLVQSVLHVATQKELIVRRTNTVLLVRIVVTGLTLLQTTMKMSFGIPMNAGKSILEKNLATCQACN